MNMRIPKADLFEKLVLHRQFKNDPYFQEHSNFIQVHSEVNVSPKTNNNFCQEEDIEDQSSWRGCWWQPKPSLPQEYFGSSTVHGLKHLVQPEQHLLERIFWCIAILSSAICSVLLILAVWDRYHRTPVVVGFDPEDVGIQEVPFPSVVICNMNQVSLDTINQLLVRADKVGNNSKMAVEARVHLHYVRTVCEGTPSFSKYHGFAGTRGKIRTTKYNISAPPGGERMFHFLQSNPAVPCQEMIRGCRWNGRVRNCTLEFKSVLTPMGTCCSFNLMPLSLKSTSFVNLVNRSNRSREEKKYLLERQWDKYKQWQNWDYSKSFKIPKGQRRPRKQHRAGAPFGLSLLLDPMAHRYFCPKMDSVGFRVGIYSPVEEVQLNRFTKTVDLDQETFMQVHPTLTLADNGLKRFSFERRQCLLGNERKLKFYKPYTYSNCLFECGALYVLKECSCIPYGLPRDLLKDRLCSSSPGPDRTCCNAAWVKIGKNLNGLCSHCKRSCMQLTYNTELTTAPLQNSSWLWRDHPESMRIPPDWADHKMSVLHVYFGDNSFVPRLRREMYGITELIANTGNLITLCLGASVLSIFEAIYFFTVRPVWSYIRRRLGGQDRTSALTNNKSNSVNIPQAKSSGYKQTTNGLRQTNSLATAHNSTTDASRATRNVLLDASLNFRDAWS